MIEIAGTPKELASQRAEVAEASRGDLTLVQQCCLAVLREKWSTLALVATDRGTPARAASAALVEVARLFRLAPVRALSAAGASAPQVAQLVDELKGPREGAGRALVALDDPRTNPAGAPLLVAVDAVLLAVRLGASELRSIEEIVELAGRERVLGCVVVG